MLTDLFADNGYLQDSLAIYACSRSPYFDYDDNVLRVFIVSALDGRIDLEAAGVEDYPEFSFGKCSPKPQKRPCTHSHILLKHGYLSSQAGV